LFPTFNTSETHKFYVYDVDGRYDGLIGSDLLKQLGARVDMYRQILYTHTASIPIIYNPNNVIKLTPRSEQRVRLPTSMANGEAILSYSLFCKGVRMPSAVSYMRKWLCNNRNTKFIR
jgi:hypothetical protein